MIVAVFFFFSVHLLAFLLLFDCIVNLIVRTKNKNFSWVSERTLLFYDHCEMLIVGFDAFYSLWGLLCWGSFSRCPCLGVFIALSKPLLLHRPDQSKSGTLLPARYVCPTKAFLVTMTVAYLRRPQSTIHPSTKAINRPKLFRAVSHPIRCSHSNGMDSNGKLWNRFAYFPTLFVPLGRCQ